MKNRGPEKGLRFFRLQRYLPLFCRYIILITEMITGAQAHAAESASHRMGRGKNAGGVLE